MPPSLEKLPLEQVLVTVGVLVRVRPMNFPPFQFLNPNRLYGF